MQADKALAVIKSRLPEKRYEHSKQVADTAVKMAEIFGADREKAQLCGLLHDYARDLPADGLLKIAEENRLIFHKVERSVPDLLHGTVGAFLLEKDLGINDEEILNAIRYHTLGAVDMNDLDKIIYLADMIEPGRDYPGVEELRSLAYEDLDQAMLWGLENTIKYCLDEKKILHPGTIEVRNCFLLKVYKNQDS